MCVCVVALAGQMEWVWVRSPVVPHARVSMLGQLELEQAQAGGLGCSVLGLPWWRAGAERDVHEWYAGMFCT